MNGGFNKRRVDNRFCDPASLGFVPRLIDEHLNQGFCTFAVGRDLASEVGADLNESRFEGVMRYIGDDP